VIAFLVPSTVLLYWCIAVTTTAGTALYQQSTLTASVANPEIPR
jgi:hypothetical protein